MVNEVNKIILQRRKDLGISQSYIADALGYSVQTISKWETGKSFPDLLSWGALAKVLQIDLDSLINCRLKSHYNDACLNNTFSSEKFAKNLRKQRRIRDLTQKDLASKLSISYQTLLAWEKGSSFPSVEQFKTLAKALNISYEDLYFGEENLVASQEQVIIDVPSTEETIPSESYSIKVPDEEVKTESVKTNKGYKKIWLFASIAFLLFFVAGSSIYAFNSKQNASSQEDNVRHEEVIRPYEGTPNIVHCFYNSDDPVETRNNAIVKIPSTSASGVRYVKSFGVDYAYDDGSEFNIVAALSGVVVDTMVFDYSVYGNSFMIEHESGIKLIYASIDNMQIEIGDEVRQGQVIATSGASLYTDECGPQALHFEIGVFDTHINPEKTYTYSTKEIKSNYEYFI